MLWLWTINIKYNNNCVYYFFSTVIYIQFLNSVVSLQEPIKQWVGFLVVVLMVQTPHPVVLHLTLTQASLHQALTLEVPLTQAHLDLVSFIT